MQKKHVLILFLLALVLGLFEAVTRTLLPFPWNAIRPVSVTMALFIVLNRVDVAIAFTVIANIIIDAYQPGTGHALLLSLILLLMAWFLVQTVLTNRSVYVAMALVAVLRVAEWVLLSLFNSIEHAIFDVTAYSGGMKMLLATVGCDALLVVIGFAVVAFLSRHFLVTLARDSRYV